MSIISDALRKAERQKQLSRPAVFAQPDQLDKIATNRANPRSRKRPTRWLMIAIVCIGGFFVITKAFESSFSLHSLERLLLQTEAKTDHLSDGLAEEGMFHLKEVDLEAFSRSEEFRLTGILFDKQRPLAIINNKILEEGAAIDQAMLLEIQPNYVRLSLQGEEFELKLSSF